MSFAAVLKTVTKPKFSHASVKSRNQRGEVFYLVIVNIAWWPGACLALEAVAPPKQSTFRIVRDSDLSGVISLP